MRLTIALCLLLLPFRSVAQDLRAQEKITVERILVDARVTEMGGEPILNLTAKDFRVKIDGIAATVESVDWIPETAAERDIADVDKAEAPDSVDVPQAKGRLLIFFFQTDFQRAAQRLQGEMKMLTYADQFAESLEPEDRVAVLSYDSHLKFRLDFTNDKQQIHDAAEHALLIDEPSRPPIVPMPSLASHLPADVLKGTSTAEKGFIVLGNALQSIPGPKSMILFGWGLGRYGAGGVHMTNEYPAAKRTLESARVSVFALDVTEADYHSLEVGLNKVAADTGGFYQKTYTFPQIAINRLEKTLVGHYELEVRKPETKAHGFHTIEVTMPKGFNAIVMARSSYVDKE